MILLGVYFALKRVLLSERHSIKEKDPEKAFRELASTCKVYGKSDVFSRARNFRAL